MEEDKKQVQDKVPYTKPTLVELGRMGSLSTTSLTPTMRTAVWRISVV